MLSLYVAAVLGLGAYVTGAPKPPNTIAISQLKEAWGDASYQTVCGDAISSGQLVNMCNLVGRGYPMQSAAGLLMAQRFRGFRIDDLAYSTEPNVPGVVADFTIDISRGTSLADVSKQIAGTGQVDLFLCSDAACTVVVDLAYIASAMTPAADATLAMGYSRFPYSLSGVSTGFLETSAAGAVVDRNSTLAPEVGSVVRQVTWELADNAAVVDASPVLMELGGLARALSAPINTAWNGLRAGHYITSDGNCVTIISFVHPWMDEQGWDRSTNCESTQTYIFDSYLVQAYLHFPPEEVTIENHIDTWVYGDTDFVQFTFNGFFKRAATTQDGSKWNEYVAPPDLYTDVDPPIGYPKTQSYGRTIHCDDYQYLNDESVGAGKNECYSEAQDRLADLKQGGVDPVADSGTFVVLTLGSASIVVLDITEPRLSAPTATTGRYTMNPIDYSNIGTSYSRVNKSALRALLKLVALASLKLPEDLPWCGGGRAYQATSTPYVRLPGGSGDVLPALDCATWERFGWGPISSAGDQTPLTGQEVFGELLQASWGNMTKGANSSEEGVSIVGYERTTRMSMLAGVDTVVQIAETLLAERVSAELAVTDTTVALYGALVNVVFTVVALLATYASRKDLLRVLLRAALGQRPLRLVAHALTASICACVVMIPPVLVLVSEQAARNGNSDGSVSQMTWVSGQASGFGTYRVVGLVSLRFAAVYDSAAYALLWVNIVLAAAGTAAMLASMARQACKAHHRTQELEAPLESARRSWDPTASGALYS
ncbi:hypothetical protein JKP88DRAFT_279216 [Tribonema minus]|uniref:Uncharacterized protein n=1 Tax=Tribonema minus TaxID=303371 RepID=A0A836CDF0_9STRA|nr:hypothetical protein JKP88DRAFT_279216 [Tribonema minus]